MVKYIPEMITNHFWNMPKIKLKLIFSWLHLPELNERNEIYYD